jgi:predicted RNA-binding protein with PIN domain
VARSYLIDGYNALHKIAQPTPDGPDACRRLVLDRVRSVLGRRTAPRAGGDRVHVVFDSRKGGERTGTHGRDGSVSWSYAEGSADDAIVDIVRRNEGSHEGMDLVVVTDDRELRGRVKQLGAQAVRVHDWFLPAEAEGPPAPEPGRSAGLRSKDFGAGDFGLPEGEIDLDALDPEDL